MEGKYLITTDEWFIAPDGKTYKAAWGEVRVISDSILGIKTNARSANWFAKVGSGENHIIIAGCQIHYAIRREEKPNVEIVEDWDVSGGDLKQYQRPTKIYIAE